MRVFELLICQARGVKSRTTLEVALAVVVVEVMAVCVCGGGEGGGSYMWAFIQVCASRWERSGRLQKRVRWQRMHSGADSLRDSVEHTRSNSET
jgi:hypothetical protein